MNRALMFAAIAAIGCVSVEADAGPFGIFNFGARSYHADDAGMVCVGGKCYPASAVTFQPTEVTVAPGSYRSTPANAVSSFGSSGGSASYVASPNTRASYSCHGGTGGYGSSWAVSPPERQSDEWLVAKAVSLQAELGAVTAAVEARPSVAQQVRERVSAARKASQAKAEVNADDEFKIDPDSIGARPQRLKASSLVYNTAPKLSPAAMAYDTPAEPSGTTIAGL